MDNSSPNLSPAAHRELPARVSRRSRSRRAMRREWLQSSLALLSGGWLGLGQVPFSLADEPGVTASKSNNKLLRQPEGLDSLSTRSKIVLELEGTLRTKPLGVEGEVEAKESAVRAKSTLDYFEKIAFKNSTPVAASRVYNEASAENWVAGKAASQELRPECRQTRMLKHEGIWQQFCPKDTLALREAQLVRSPINTAQLELLLPEEAARPDSTWTIPNSSAAELFNLDAVHSNDLRAKITKVENGIASMAIDGSVQATANSVPTEIKVSGNFRAQVVNDSIMVTWVGLAMSEARQISQAEPGFTIQARLRLIRTAGQHDFGQDADELRALAAEDAPGRWLVEIESPAGGYRMLANRKWQTFVDTAEESMLRLIENDIVVAQCNITQLPRLEPGSQRTLEGMQADIEKTLGDRFEQFLESSEALTDSKLRLLRCVVSGSTEDVPIQWIYNQLSDDNGRRVSVVFTMGANMTDRFAAADVQMTSSFELLGNSTGKPTPAPLAAAESDIQRSAKGDSETKR